MSEEMTMQERRDYLVGFDKLAAQLASPERQASEQEIRHIQDLRQQATVYSNEEVSTPVISGENDETMDRRRSHQL